VIRPVRDVIEPEAEGTPKAGAHALRAHRARNGDLPFCAYVSIAKHPWARLPSCALVEKNSRLNRLSIYDA